MMKTFGITLTSVVWGLLFSPLAFAGDLDREPYQLRLILALDRPSNYSSTLARQASIAFPGNASNNPASSDFVSGKRNKRDVFTATNMHYKSESDWWATAFVVSATFTEDISGSLSTAYAYTDTLDQQNNEKLNDLLRSDEYFLAYSKMVNSNLSLGVKGRLVHGDVVQETGLLELGLAPGRVDAKLSGFDLEFGGLYSKDKRTFYGVTLGLGRTDATIKVFNIFQLGAIPPDTFLAKEDDDLTTYSLGAGIGYLPSETIGLYADLVYLAVDSDALGVAEVYKSSLGFDYKFSNKKIFRGGITVDSESELTFSAGLQLYLTENIPLDIAYQYNGAPEIEQEYGDFNVIALSAAYKF